MLPLVSVSQGGEQTSMSKLRGNTFLKVTLKGKPAQGLSEVLDDADKAVELAPDNESILDSRGQILLALGRIDAAFADLDKAISKGYESAGTYYGRGRCYELKDDPEAAKADYKKALTLDADGGRRKHAQAQARAGLARLGIANQAKGATSK